MSAASTATSTPVPIAIPISACASAGASFSPSPTTATALPCSWIRRTSSQLLLRQHLGDHPLDPDRPRHRFGGPAIVAGEQHDLEPHAA